MIGMLSGRRGLLLLLGLSFIGCSASQLLEENLQYQDQIATGGYQPTAGAASPASYAQPAQPAQPAAPAAAPAPPPAAQHTLTPEEDWVCKAMASLQGRVCAAMQKKMADDVVKRLGELDAKLKAGQVSKEVTSQVTQWCQAMDRNDHATAGTIQTTLTSTVWDDHKNWLQATKRMVDQVKKMGQ
mmetsp:Transcript_53893/g.125932  ORF Transcript_53893/g.125932 Transcript_53893/m.125932 type:complete len:185 (-) Transcript_53893:468-1022(-)